MNNQLAVQFLESCLPLLDPDKVVNKELPSNELPQSLESYSSYSEFSSLLLICSVLGGSEFKNMFQFWKPSQVLERSIRAYPDCSTLIFADYSYEMHCYGVKLNSSKEGEIWILEGANYQATEKISDDLEGFLKAVTTDPEAVNIF